MPISRRDLLSNSVLVGLPMLVGVRRSTAVELPGEPYAGPVIVNIFQRGGADGLNIVAPYGDGSYHDLRPTIGVPAPGSGDGAAIDLDGFFGFHPALAPLKPLYDAGSLAVVHAAGNPSDSHSHFTSQDYMERGVSAQNSLSTGWLGRHLVSTDSGNTSVFRAVAIGPAVQKSMIGTLPVIGIEDIASYGLLLPRLDVARVRGAILELYTDPVQLLDLTTRETFTAMDALAAIQIPPDTGAYPNSDFGNALKTLAQLIKAGLGIEVASVDIGGWDTHTTIVKQIQDRLADLAAGLAAFTADLGSEMARVTVVTMTEFGRRAYENASGGTDHGHGSVMLALGGGVAGGKVYSDWPGLAQDKLYDSGDLQVTTDFREVLGELLVRRGNEADLGAVFPGFTMPAYPGIFSTGSSGTSRIRRKINGA